MYPFYNVQPLFPFWGPFLLGINDKPAKENDEIIALQKEVNELKNIIRKANQMVPPPMKEMLPQDMKNAMDKVGQ